MPLSPPKVVVPITACSSYVHLQGQFTGASVRIIAIDGGASEEVFAGQAASPDQSFKLYRRLRAGEIIRATQSLPTDPQETFSAGEVVQPEPDMSELGPLTPQSHLYTCARCAAIGGGYPGADIVVTSPTGSELGRGFVDPATGAARVVFAAPLLSNEALTATQSICALNFGSTLVPAPDSPVGDDRTLPAPRILGSLQACARAVDVEGVKEGALVRLYRNGIEDSAAWFDYSNLLFVINQPLNEGDVISVDQQFPDCSYSSPRSDDVAVLAPGQVFPPDLLGPFCTGTASIGVGDLRFGAQVQIVQTNDGIATGHVIANVEAWEEVCDIPLLQPLDAASGQFVIATQTLCALTSPPSPRRQTLTSLVLEVPTLKVTDPIFQCGRVVRVEGIHPGARVEVYMTCEQWPGIRMIAALQVYQKVADIPVSPPLVVGKEVFARQLSCGGVSGSPKVPVQRIDDLGKPTVQDCGTHLDVGGVVPGALVEVFRNDLFFASAHAGAADVRIPLGSPLKAPDKLTARQTLCANTSAFSDVFSVVDNVDKVRLELVPAGRPEFPDLVTERVCQLTGSPDPEGKPTINDCDAAGIAGADLGIPVDHDTGDGRLHFFFGDTFVSDRVDDFPSNGDCMASTDATEAGPDGPTLNFLYHLEDGEPVPHALYIPNVSLGVYEVPTGGFSHDGKLYVFASTDHYTDPVPRTVGIGRNEDYMGRSVLAFATDWTVGFDLVPGYDDISNHQEEKDGRFKFINIAACKIRNQDWKHLPDNALPGGEGLFLLGSGRYHTSRPCLAYVPLPAGQHPVFTEWRYFAGFDAITPGTGPCGTPRWSKEQRDAWFLWDDSPFYKDQNGQVHPENIGVVGELSLAFIPQLGLWVALYDNHLRSAPYPWGPWSDPLVTFDFFRDHKNPNNPTKPGWLGPGDFAYGPYIVPRFTEYEPATGVATLYYAMSMGVHHSMLMRTRVRLACKYNYIGQYFCPDDRQQ